MIFASWKAGTDYPSDLNGMNSRRLPQKENHAFERVGVRKLLKPRGLARNKPLGFNIMVLAGGAC